MIMLVRQHIVNEYYSKNEHIFETHTHIYIYSQLFVELKDIFWTRTKYLFFFVGSGVKLQR